MLFIKTQLQSVLVLLKGKQTTKSYYHKHNTGYTKSRKQADACIKIQQYKVSSSNLAHLRRFRHCKVYKNEYVNFKESDNKT